MFNFRLKLVAILLMLALAASACGGGDDSSTETVSGSTDSAETDSAQTDSAEAPELPRQFFAAATADGGQIDLGDLDGQDIVLWFWAPW